MGFMVSQGLEVILGLMASQWLVVSRIRDAPRVHGVPRD